MVKIRTKTLTMMVPAVYPFFTTVSVCGAVSGYGCYPQFTNPSEEILSSRQESSSEVVFSEEIPSLQESSSSQVCLPEALSTDQAKHLLSRLAELGVLDAAYQPLHISQSKKGVLAQQIAAKLGIKNQWVTFAHFWHVDANCLRSGYNRGMESKSIGKFLDFIHPAMQDAAM